MAGLVGMLWLALMSGARAESAPLVVGVVVGPARWLGEVPSIYKPSRTGVAKGLEASVPVGENGWSAGGGALASGWAVEVPFALTDPSVREVMRWDTIVLHAEAGRSISVGEKGAARVRLGPAAVVSGVGTNQGGGANLDCDGDFCVPTGEYDIEDDRLVAQEVINEAPVLWTPGGRLAAGMAWVLGNSQPGFVLSVDAYGVLTTDHWRSGINGTQAGVVVGLGLGGDAPERKK